MSAAATTGMTTSAIVNVEVFFQAEKIKGGYALIQVQSPRIDKSNWLLIKLKDNYVGSFPEDLEEEGQFVIAGRTIRDLDRRVKE